MSTDALSYAIDDQDHLIKVDEGYYSFAEENGWDGAEATLGRSLWNFVAGEELKRLQRLLLRRLRDERRSVELPLRCDGPAMRREMEMRIAAHRSGQVILFSAKVRSEEDRANPQALLDPDASRSLEEVEMCGWCDRFLVDGEWVEVEEAAKRLELFARAQLPAIEHGVCPRCSELLLAA